LDGYHYPRYGGLPPTQLHGIYGMNTDQSVVNHGDYPMDYGMRPQLQQQVAYYSTPQSAGPNQGRMVGPFLSSFSPNTVMGANNNPQMISGMNTYAGMNQYPQGMMRSQMIFGRSPYHGGMRMGTPNTAFHIGPISTSGDPTLFQSPIRGNDLGMYNRTPNPGGNLVTQNSAATAAGQKHNSLSPYQYKTPSYLPNSTPQTGPTQTSFQGTPPPPPNYNSTSTSLPSFNQASMYQVVPPNQTTPNQFPLPAQDASNSLLFAPETLTATSTAQLQDTASLSQLSPSTAIADEFVSCSSSQKTNTLAATAVGKDSIVTSQASSQQVHMLVLFCLHSIDVSHYCLGCE